MQLRRFRLRFRRNLRKRQRQATDLGYVAEDSLDRYVVKRLTHLLSVKRFLLGWIGLLLDPPRDPLLSKTFVLFVSFVVPVFSI